MELPWTSTSLRGTCIRNWEMRSSTSWVKPPLPSPNSLRKWCTAIRLRTLSLSFQVSRTTKTQQSPLPQWTHSENLLGSSPWVALPARISLLSSKIFLLISQLVITSESSLTQSFLTLETIKEELLERIELLLRTFLKWLTTIAQVISKYSLKRFGYPNIIGGLWRTVTMELKLKWTSYLRLNPTGKLFKSSTTPSTSQRWMMLRVKASERNTSITWVTSTQIEPRGLMTPESTRSSLIDLRVLLTTSTSREFQIQWEPRLSQRSIWSWLLTTARRETCQGDTQWLLWVKCTTECSMPILSLRNLRSWTSHNLQRFSALMLSQRTIQLGRRESHHSNSTSIRSRSDWRQ